MPSLGGLFSAGESSVGAESFLIWGVLYAVVQSIAQPILLDLQQQVSKLGLDAGLKQVLSPADLSRMVVRNIISQANGEATAAFSGVDPGDFDLLVSAYGNPPGPDWLARMQWRGDVLGEGTGPDATSYQQGVDEGDIKNKWVQAILAGALEWPSPDEIINAIVRNQTTSVPLTELYQMCAGDPQWLQLRIDTRGNPPSPTELVEFVRRGLIPFKGTGSGALSFEQGIYEGDTKDKWEPLYERLTDYIPPPRTITTLQSHGVITTDQATALYQENGLSPELAGAYAASAVSSRVASHAQLTEANILKLYSDGLLDNAQATGMLANLGIDGAVAAYLLELQDFDLAARAYNSAVTRVGTLYVNRKIDRQSALDALQGLDVPAAGAQRLMTTWDQETATNIKSPTAAQVADALVYNIVDQPTAMAMLEALGYNPFDAWVVLSVRNHAPLPNQPPPGHLPGQAGSVV